MGPTISTKEKRGRGGKEAKLKGPVVSHQRHHCVTWGEYVNVFFGSTLKNILLFCSVQPI